MNAAFEQFNTLWREQRQSFTEQFADDLAVRGGSFYSGLPRADLLVICDQFVDTWQDAFAASDIAPIVAFSQKISQQRLRDHVSVDAMMLVLDVFRDHIWQLLEQLSADGVWDIALIKQLELWIHQSRKELITSYSQILSDAQAQLTEREQALFEQRRLIQELSAPIVPIHEGVLVLPLVGAIDARRASQIMELALEQIVAYQADVLILDITGVPVVDTGVAHHILQMARAVMLLGSQVVLVGIGAEIAQTIVQLGVELRDITTLANLQAGITHALALQGFAIRPIEAPKRDMQTIL